MLCPSVSSFPVGESQIMMGAPGCPLLPPVSNPSIPSVPVGESQVLMGASNCRLSNPSAPLDSQEEYSQSLISGLPAVIAQARFRAQAGISSLARPPISDPKSEEDSGWWQTQQSQGDLFSETNDSQIPPWWSDDESTTDEIIGPTPPSPSPTQANPSVQEAPSSSSPPHTVGAPSSSPTHSIEDSDFSLWDEFVDLMGWQKGSS